MHVIPRSYLRRINHVNIMHFFDLYANQEWFAEEYLPSIHKNYLRNRIVENKQEALRLLQEINDNSLFVMHETPATSASSASSASATSSPQIVQMAGTVRDPFDGRCIYIHSLDPRCSRACLLAFLQKIEGFQAVYFGDVLQCPPTELNRPVYVLFDSSASADAAFPQMNAVNIPFVDTMGLGLVGLREEERLAAPTFFTLRCSKWRTGTHASIINSVANTPRRVAKDLEQTRALVNAFETYWGLQVGLVEAVRKYREEHAWMKEMEEIGVLVHLLRRVFGYEYWLGEWLGEFGRCYHHHGRDMIRSSYIPQAGKVSRKEKDDMEKEREGEMELEEEKEEKEEEEEVNRERREMEEEKEEEEKEEEEKEEEEEEEEEENAWCRRLDENTNSMLQKLQGTAVATQLEEVTEMEKREEEIREKATSAYIQKNIVLPDKTSFMEMRECNLCHKNFKTGDYVAKHIMNKHKDLILAHVNKSVLFEVVRSEFLKSPSERLPTIIPKKQSL